MDIKQVLAFKGSSVFSVRPGSPVSEAVKLLHEKGIGAVIAMEEKGGNVLGVLSERDVVRVIAEEGPAALQRAVADVMTRDVVACTSDSTIDTVIAGMDARTHKTPVPRPGPYCSNSAVFSFFQSNGGTLRRTEPTVR